MKSASGDTHEIKSFQVRCLYPSTRPIARACKRRALSLHSFIFLMMLWTYMAAVDANCGRNFDFGERQLDLFLGGRFNLQNPALMMIQKESSLSEEYHRDCSYENVFCKKNRLLPLRRPTIFLKAITHIRGGESNSNQDDQKSQIKTDSQLNFERDGDGKPEDGIEEEIQQIQDRKYIGSLRDRNAQQYSHGKVPPNAPSWSTKHQRHSQGTGDLSALRQKYQSKYYGVRPETQNNHNRIVPPSPIAEAQKGNDDRRVYERPLEQEMDTNKHPARPSPYPPPPPPIQDAAINNDQLLMKEDQRSEPGSRSRRTHETMRHHEIKPIIDDYVPPVAKLLQNGAQEKLVRKEDNDTPDLRPPPPPPPSSSSMLDVSNPKQKYPCDQQEEMMETPNPVDKNMNESNPSSSEGNLPDSSSATKPRKAQGIEEDTKYIDTEEQANHVQSRHQEGEEGHHISDNISRPIDPVVDDSELQLGDSEDLDRTVEELASLQKESIEGADDEAKIENFLEEDEHNFGERDISSDFVDGEPFSSAEMTKLQRSLEQKSTIGDDEQSSSISSWMMQKVATLGKRIAKSMWEKGADLVFKSVSTAEKERFEPIQLNSHAISLPVGGSMPWGNEHQWVTHTMALFTLYFDLWSIKCPQNTEAGDSLILKSDAEDVPSTCEDDASDAFNDSVLEEVGTQLNHAESMLVSTFLSNAVTSVFLNEAVLNVILPAVYNQIDSHRPPPAPAPLPQPKVLKREKTIITKTTKSKQTILSRINTDEDLDDMDFARLLVELEEGSIEEIIEEVGYEYDEEPLEDLIEDEIKSEEVLGLEVKKPDHSESDQIQEIENTDVEDDIFTSSDAMTDEEINIDETSDEDDLLEDDELEILEAARLHESSDWIDQFCDDEDDYDDYDEE